MSLVLKHARPDGTFIALVGGLPYHIEKDDPLYGLAADLARGSTLEPEPSLSPTAPTKRVLAPLLFFERFLPDERIAIRRAARTNEGLEDWLEMARLAQEIDLDDPRTVSGMNALVNARALSAARRDEILS